MKSPNLFFQLQIIGSESVRFTSSRCSFSPPELNERPQFLSYLRDLPVSGFLMVGLGFDIGFRSLEKFELGLKLDCVHLKLKDTFVIVRFFYVLI